MPGSAYTVSMPWAASDATTASAVVIGWGSGLAILCSLTLGLCRSGPDCRGGWASLTKRGGHAPSAPNQRFTPPEKVPMHRYRTNTCGALRASDIGRDVRLSGWVHRKRDHGGVLFVDLRDHYGITQVVADSDSPALPILEGLRAESVVTIDGTVKARAEGTAHPNLATGEIEVFAKAVTIQSAAQ